MTTEQPAPPSGPPAQAPAREEHHPNWRRRIIVGAALVAAAVILYFLGAAYLPRWWAHRIGDQVDQSTAQGIGIGLFYGAVFTLLPLLVLWLTFRRRRSWKVWLAGTIGALILAGPNLLTLGIVLGTGGAAHAGERTLDVEAPYFRGSSLIGAIAAAVIVLAAMWLVSSRRRSRRREAGLRAELRARDEELKKQASGQG